jgi:hypothetical protein
MLTRLGSALIVGVAAVAVTSGTAGAAPCHTVGDTVICSAGSDHHHGGSGGSGGGGGGGATGPGLGCANLGNTIACPPGADPAPVPHVPTIDVAENARDELAVPAPHVHTAPADRTFVEIRTGLWVDAADFAPASVTVRVPDQQVTATADPVNVTWNMGEAVTVCQGPGVAGGTTCGYTYRRSSAGRPGHAYQISATITWKVTWTCAPAATCDQLGGVLAPLQMTTAARLAVGEVQTESRPG